MQDDAGLISFRLLFGCLHALSAAGWERLGAPETAQNQTIPHDPALCWFRQSSPGSSCRTPWGDVCCLT
eukprot:2836511-Alexandrium_andersonii.AAC.1